MKLFALRRLDVSPDVLSFRLLLVREKKNNMASAVEKYAFVSMSLKAEPLSITAYMFQPNHKKEQSLFGNLHSSLSCQLFIQTFKIACMYV